MTPASRYITPASRYLPRYHARPRSDSTEFRGIGRGSSNCVCVLVVQDGKLIQSGSSAGVLVLVDKFLWDTVYPSGKLV